MAAESRRVRISSTRLAKDCIFWSLPCNHVPVSFVLLLLSRACDWPAGNAWLLRSRSHDAARTLPTRSLRRHCGGRPIAQAVPVRTITLEGARASFVSCHLLAIMTQPGDYSLDVVAFPAASGLQSELYREWFHYLPKTKNYYPDALIPVASAVSFETARPRQSHRESNCTVVLGGCMDSVERHPGSYTAKAILNAGGKSSTVPIQVKVVAAVVPAEDAVAMDHNTYGTSWLAPTIIPR